MLFLLIAAAFVGYWQISTNPLSAFTNPKFGFQYYKPTELPSGFRISEKRIDLGMRPQDMAAEMNLRNGDWVYEIRETNGNFSDPSAMSTTANNYNPLSSSVTCSARVSPKEQGYRLCHWVDYGRISVYEVRFLKYDKDKAGNSTFIDTEFPAIISKVISSSEINKYVDSFTKTRATGFKLMQGGI